MRKYMNCSATDYGVGQNHLYESCTKHTKTSCAFVQNAVFEKTSEKNEKSA